MAKVLGLHVMLVVVLAVQVYWHISHNLVEARALFKNHKHQQLRPWNILRGNVNALSIAELEYYVQVEIGGQDLGVLIEAINTTFSNNFGHTELFAFNVTEGADPTSTQLGTVYGYTVQASYSSTDSHGVEVEILVYDDGTTSGTISLQGHIVNGPNEVSIVGGTGDFRGASGYGLITYVNTTGSIVLYHHELHFL